MIKFLRLKILCTNNHLKHMGGSETFTYTLAKELERQSHSVDVFTLSKGVVSEKLNTVDELKDEYDIMFINHNSCLEHILKKKIKGFKILTCHGIQPQLEQPIPGADSYVVVAEEIQEHLKNRGFNSTVIRNGVDCKRFFPIRKINAECKSVLSMCHGEEAKNNISEACKKLGISFNFTGTTLEGRTFEIEKLIFEADLVFGFGRSTYESMACGRNVISYDSKWAGLTGDGIITPNNVQLLQKKSFGGRTFNFKFTVDELVEEIKKYKQEYGDFNRQYALENFNIEKQVNKYFQIWRQRGTT